MAGRLRIFIGVIAICSISISAICRAQTTNVTNVTPSGLNTKVSNPTTNPNITGGTRPGGAAGTNLFHSFGEFNIATDNVATFLNSGSVDLTGNQLPGGLPTSNIFGRVTGGKPSNIFGAIQTTNFGAADQTLNFGAANLYLINPSGILFGPTASLNVGGSFTATTADYLKMTDGAKFYASPSQPSVLSIAAVAAFGFLGTNPGGTITIQGSTLRTNGFAPMTFIGRDLTVNNTTTPGITITGSAALAPYYNPGGLVLISVGQVADPITGGEVRVAPATSEISPFSLTYDLSGFGNGGTVVAETFVADHFMVLTPPSGNVTINRASTDGDLTPININTGILQINEGLFASGALASGPIDLRAANSFRLNGTISSVNSEFQGTPITITSPSVLLASNARIMTDNSGFFAGPVILNVGTLEVSSGSLVSSRATPGGTGSGDITIQGLDGAGSGATSVNIAGSITSEVRSFGTGGNIVINAQNISLDSGGLISSAAPIPTFDGAPPGSGGSAGNVTINASGMFQSSGGTVTSTTVDGPGGNISLKVGAMSLTNGTTIAASTTGSGKAGNVTLEVGTLTASNATLTTTSTSSTNTAGTAGNITVTSAQDLTLRNSVVQTSADQASGGNIKLTAPNLIRIVDSTITSSVKGQAGSNGGNIDIDPQVVVIQNSDILARANAGAGGNINIAALGAVLVDPNSAIDASAATGVSGSVNISSPIQDSAAPWSL